VTLFFVLSGFLLSRPYFVAHFSGGARPRTTHYLWKRALRILPLYWIVVVAALVIDRANRGAPLSTWLTDLTLTQIYSSRTPSSSLTQMWSLATEAAFYLLLPALVLLCLGATRPGASTDRPEGALRRTLLVLAALALAGIVWTAWAAHSRPELPVHQWLPGFMPWFGTGMAFAAVSADLRVRPRPHLLERTGHDLVGCWILATVVFAIACTELAGPRTLEPASPWEAVSKNLLYAVAAALYVLPLVFGPERDGAARRWLSRGLPFFLGEISYGIFCLHMLVLVVGMDLLGMEVFGGGFWKVLAMVLAVTLPLSTAAFYCVERPLLRLKNAGPFARTSPTTRATASSAHH
jgi:peptidoglycan/LPS O-acetylase OafA/YrhL